MLCRTWKQFLEIPITCFCTLVWNGISHLKLHSVNFDYTACFNVHQRIKKYALQCTISFSWYIKIKHFCICKKCRNTLGKDQLETSPVLFNGCSYIYAVLDTKIILGNSQFIIFSHFIHKWVLPGGWVGWIGYPPPPK